MASPAIGASTVRTDGAGAAPYTSSAITTSASGSSFIVAVAVPNASVITSVTDSKSNTYTTVHNILESNDGVRMYVYKCENGTGGASHTFTVNFSAGGGYAMTVVEVTGGATSSIIDVSNTQYDTTSPFACSVTTTVIDTLLVANIMTGQGGGGTFTVGGGFTIAQQGSTANPMAVATRAAATATSYNPAWTHSLYNAMARSVLAIKPAVTGPAITSVSTGTPREGASLTITGTNFGASQGAGDVKINGVAQTVTSWSDTSVVVTVVLGTNKFGAAYNVILTDSSSTPSNTYAGITGLLPANSGLSYVDIGTPNTTAAYRLTSSADLVSGDQVEYENKGSTITVNTDGTFSAAIGPRSFLFRVWTSGSGYGAQAIQTLRGVPNGNGLLRTRADLLLRRFRRR